MLIAPAVSEQCPPSSPIFPSTSAISTATSPGLRRVPLLRRSVWSRVWGRLWPAASMTFSTFSAAPRFPISVAESTPHRGHLRPGHDDLLARTPGIYTTSGRAGAARPPFVGPVHPGRSPDDAARLGRGQILAMVLLAGLTTLGCGSWGSHTFWPSASSPESRLRSFSGRFHASADAVRPWQHSAWGRRSGPLPWAPSGAPDRGRISSLPWSERQVNIPPVVTIAGVLLIGKPWPRRTRHHGAILASITRSSAISSWARSMEFHSTGGSCWHSSAAASPRHARPESV